MRQIRPQKHKIAWPKILDAVANKTPSRPRKDGGEFEFRMKMKRRVERMASILPAGKGLGLACQDFLKMDTHG